MIPFTLRREVQMADVSYRLGIDIGGTFTDLSLMNEATGELTELKTPTVTDDPAQGIINGLKLLKERGVDLSKSNISYTA